MTLPSREFGLAFGFILGRYFINMQDLHYGFWDENLPVEIRNLPQAQELYTNFLVSHIPSDVKTVLDIGCGAGNTAKKLLQMKYQVECVSPNGPLMDIAREVLGSKSTLYECHFQDLQVDKKYDLLLFSESLLFMPLDPVLVKSFEMLRAGGYLLISDVFRIPAEGNSPIGGGQHLSAFKEAIGRLPFQSIKDVDITSYIAPTFTVLDDAYIKAIKPAYDLLMKHISAKHPLLTKLLRWKFGYKIEKYEKKHFSSQRTANNFAKHKSYRLFLYKKLPMV